MISHNCPFKEAFRTESSCTLQGKFHLCFSFLGTALPQSQFPHLCVCERFIYPQDWSTYFPAAEQTVRQWKYINPSQIYKCRNWETEHYNSVLEITVSFLGIHKGEPDIYIGFSLALHLQCTVLLAYVNLLTVILQCSQRKLSLLSHMLYNVHTVQYINSYSPNPNISAPMGGNASLPLSPPPCYQLADKYQTVNQTKSFATDFTVTRY